MKKKVLVLGGYGVYGSRITRALMDDSAIECIVAGRRPPADHTGNRAVATIALDARSKASLHAILPGMFAVVNASGPFHGQDYTVAEQCAALGVHYVDLADSRDHVMGFARLDAAARQSGALLVTGAGFAPAISALLIDSVAADFEALQEIHVVTAMGNRTPRGSGPVRALLHQAGGPMRVKDAGQWREISSWSRPQRLIFPRPVGRRRLYQIDAPDLDLFPQRYGAASVACHAGFQLNTFNFGLSYLAWLRRCGRIGDIARWSRTLDRVARLFRARGSMDDAYGVVLHGRRGTRSLTHRIFLVARNGSGVMVPCSPAIALARRWVRDGVDTGGATACLDLVTLDEIKDGLKGYDIVLYRD